MTDPNTTTVNADTKVTTVNPDAWNNAIGGRPPQAPIPDTAAEVRANAFAIAADPMLSCRVPTPKKFGAK